MGIMLLVIRLITLENVLKKSLKTAGRLINNNSEQNFKISIGILKYRNTRKDN